MTVRTADDALRQMLDRGRERAVATDCEHLRLWQALTAATEGGKRFRPALLVAVHDALGGSSPDAAAEVGAAIELLHTAFLIHDDVIDGDDQRRGRPNVSGTFRAQGISTGAEDEGAGQLGRTAGILAGDLALAAAVRAVACCGASPEVTQRLLDLFDAALHTTAAGELADVRLSLDETVSLAQSLVVTEQKTSAYSFILPLRAGAVLAGAGEDVVRRLGEVGSLLGIAFQLMDDLLGVFGDPDSTGKSVTSDLQAGKQTPLLVHSRTTTEWEQIREYVGCELTDAQLDEVRHLLTVAGSRSFVETLAEGHLCAARSMLRELGIPPDLLAVVSAGSGALLPSREVAA
jgi:geranylgeranyl diphosphate synthase type II